MWTPRCASCARSARNSPTWAARRLIQSQLRRSAADCAALATPGSRVRLCKGAYNAPQDVAFTSRHEVDRS